jgi:site-specific recombinase XerC
MFDSSQKLLSDPKVNLDGYLADLARQRGLSQAQIDKIRKTITESFEKYNPVGLSNGFGKIITDLFNLIVAFFGGFKDRSIAENITAFGNGSGQRALTEKEASDALSDAYVKLRQDADPAIANLATVITGTRKTGENIADYEQIRVASLGARIFSALDIPVRPASATASTSAEPPLEPTAPPHILPRTPPTPGYSITG